LAAFSSRTTWTCSGSFRSLAKKKNRYGPLCRTVGLTRPIVAALAARFHGPSHQPALTGQVIAKRDPANERGLSARNDRRVTARCWRSVRIKPCSFCWYKTKATGSFPVACVRNRRPAIGDWLRATAYQLPTTNQLQPKDVRRLDPLERVAGVDDQREPRHDGLVVEHAMVRADHRTVDAM
jgi:hypothetical protein